MPAVTDLHFQAIFENSRDAVIKRERVIYINQKNDTLFGVFTLFVFQMNLMII